MRLDNEGLHGSLSSLAFRLRVWWVRLKFSSLIEIVIDLFEFSKCGVSCSFSLGFMQ